jgi:hypothetical protein
MRSLLTALRRGHWHQDGVILGARVARYVTGTLMRPR